MDKRKLRLILLGTVGVIILVIGIKAAIIYSDPMPQWASEGIIQNILEGRNAKFTAWIVNWVVKPVGLFAILTAALVVSRVILKKKD